jgi:predicted CoA-binding protein
MAVQSLSLETIEDFLAQKRIAMVGISRDPANFSVKLFEEFCRRGYDVVPVNPNTAEVQGRRCFARVQDVQPPVEAVLLMTSPEVTETVARDCAEAGIRQVWIQGDGQGLRQRESGCFLRGARDAGGSGAVSVHVSAGHCGLPSLSRVYPQDHGPVSASCSGFKST